MANRHTLDESDEAILDAARTCVMAFGVRRTTFTDVARRAGLSRMTLYRRHPDITSLLQALMTREFGRVIERWQEQAGRLPTARERLVEGIVRGAELLTADPLFLRILDVDPELLLPYVTERLGQFQCAALDVAEAQIAEGAAEGSIRAGDPARLAAALELAARGFVFSAQADERRVGLADALKELRHMLDAYLRP